MRSVATSVFLVIFAFLIDALQWFMGIAFFALGMVAPTATGAIIGNQYCPDGVLNGACQALAGSLGFLFNLIPGVAQAGGAVGTAVGMALGIVVGFMLGPVLVLFLWLTGTVRWKYVAGACIGETVPFLGFLPGWTGATVACVLSSRAKQAAGGLSGASTLATALAPELAPVLTAARTLQRHAPPRDTAEGEERTEAARSQLLQSLPVQQTLRGGASQGIRSVRPSVPAEASSAPAATDEQSLHTRYGFAA